jgi:hypothetical protein
MGLSSLPVRPWREVKSQRVAPKRLNTEGFACPNHQCLYFGITEAHIHASFWRRHPWSRRADPDLSRSCLSHHVQRTTPHPFIPLKPPSVPGRNGADGASLRAGSFRRRACLRLPLSHTGDRGRSEGGGNNRGLHLCGSRVETRPASIAPGCADRGCSHVHEAGKLQKDVTAGLFLLPFSHRKHSIARLLP